jgi:putative transcriptional regulator
MPSLNGKLLIASPRLADPNFRRTVVLLVRDDDEGSLGLVLNRPMPVTVKQACEQALEVECKLDAPLYQGGPCEGPLMVLHEGDGDDDDLRVAKDLFFTTDKDKVEKLLACDGDGNRVKFFVGYSGWGQGQLAGELDEGAWVSCAATSDLVFGEVSREWSKLLTHLTYGPELPLDRIPEDPSLN